MSLLTVRDNARTRKLGVAGLRAVLFDRLAERVVVEIPAAADNPQAALAPDSVWWRTRKKRYHLLEADIDGA